MKENQKTRIVNYIKQFGSITSKDAYNDLGITQLGARIDDLEKLGYCFKKEWETGKNRFGEDTPYKRYSLIEENMNHIPVID